MGPEGVRLLWRCAILKVMLCGLSLSVLAGLLGDSRGRLPAEHLALYDGRLGPDSPSSPFSRRPSAAALTIAQTRTEAFERINYGYEVPHQ